MPKIINKAKVYVNGGLVGFHDNPKELKRKLLEKRRKYQIDPQINISYFEDINEIYISTDGGRLQRPLIVVENGKSKLTEEILEEVKTGKISWVDLLSKGIVEYLDAEEEENAYIALNEESLTEEHTHLEITEIGIFSTVTSMIPFIEHNMAGKALHGAKLFKQAIGIPLINYKYRFDTEMHILYYPQKELVTTRTQKILNVEKRPLIQNAIMAIMPYRGYNMLDAYVINRGAIERGLFRSSYYRSYSAIENRYPSGQTDEFTIPKEDIIGYHNDEAYLHLNEDGLPMIESYIPGNGVVIGKISPPRFVEEISEFGVINEEKRESSVTSRKHLYGCVDNVMLTETINGDKLAKVKVRTTLIPQTGDKFSSRHAQKGVVGAVIDEADMPFTARGVKPDFILNPHSIPSRMTLGHLFESITGKAVALSGEEIDGTAFVNDKDYIFKLLKKFGFREDGKEVFYDGITGQKIEMPIFVGPLSVSKLVSHFVISRIQARDKGPVQLLTRQPTEGKQKGGGLRFGEMEGEAVVAYGAAMTLQEKLMDETDTLITYICEDCGVPVIDDIIRNKRVCQICKGENVHPIKISYGLKLLLDELKSMGILPKLNLGDKIE